MSQYLITKVILFSHMSVKDNMFVTISVTEVKMFCHNISDKYVTILMTKVILFSHISVKDNISLSQFQ
jgi:hypothetical protein